MTMRDLFTASEAERFAAATDTSEAFDALEVRLGHPDSYTRAALVAALGAAPHDHYYDGTAGTWLCRDCNTATDWCDS